MRIKSPWVIISHLCLVVKASLLGTQIHSLRLSMLWILSSAIDSEEPPTQFLWTAIKFHFTIPPPSRSSLKDPDASTALSSTSCCHHLQQHPARRKSLSPSHANSFITPINVMDPLLGHRFRGAPNSIPLDRHKIPLYDPPSKPVFIKRSRCIHGSFFDELLPSSAAAVNDDHFALGY
ncbi:hypothetical protein CDAR_185671 [Caerostris darwini]|uniref:Uncharacterized protein n=1 Tax=Caerostris darwini TaxID=1538125 RepID=A0AAV4TAT4_9ARAC|nr:hypothetical protein CDAR_185671 [Caerostris darwini]